MSDEKQAMAELMKALVSTEGGVVCIKDFYGDKASTAAFPKKNLPDLIAALQAELEA